MSRDRPSYLDPTERSFGCCSDQEAGDETSRLGRLAVGHRSVEAELERRDDDALDEVASAREQPAGSSNGPDGTPNMRTASRSPSGASAAATQYPGQANDAGSSIGTRPRLRPASHWRQKTFASRRRVSAVPGSRPSATARQRGNPGSEPIIRSSVRADATAERYIPPHGHVHDAVPRLQGVVRRRAGDPGAPARRRSQRGYPAPQTSP